MPAMHDRDHWRADAGSIGARAPEPPLGPGDFAEIDRIEPLTGGVVHLWLWHAADAFPPRQVSALARAQLADLLKAYAGVVEAPTIERGEHGKPFVSAGGFPHFNVSHSGHCVLFAFSADRALGVDVEALSRRHAPLELATRFFAEDEARALAALDPDQREAAFMRLWTSKEAILKAIGHGLSFGLDRVRFGIDAKTHAVRLMGIAEEAGTPGDWQLHALDPAPGHGGALAWRGPPMRIRAFRLGAAVTAG